MASTSNNAIIDSDDNNDVNLVEDWNKENECKIEILNDDCLTHIFTFLPRKQLIRIERVCKRWKAVALSCWSTVKKVSTFDIASGPYVSEREMAYYLDHTVKYCTALQYLEIKYLSPLEEIVSSGSFMHLEELILDGCFLTDAELRIFVNICPNITALTICTYTEDLSVESLQSLNLQKLTLDVEQCSCEFMDSLIAIFKRMENLKYLSLTVDVFQEMTSKQFQQILENSPNVEHLTVTKCKSHRITTIGTSTFGIPRNLVSLDLHDNSFVNDALIKEISENCVNLESLNISGCRNVTDVGLRVLVNLPHLKFLTLGYQGEFYLEEYESDSELGRLASRKKLKISYE